MNNQKVSIYEEITAKIITALEDGVNPWVKPWQSVHYGPFRNALTNRPYRGMNVLLLNLVALAVVFLLFRHQLSIAGLLGSLRRRAA